MVHGGTRRLADAFARRNIRRHASKTPAVCGRRRIPRGQERIVAKKKRTPSGEERLTRLFIALAAISVGFGLVGQSGIIPH
jgi:hypothetical protein